MCEKEGLRPRLRRAFGGRARGATLACMMCRGAGWLFIGLLCPGCIVEDNPDFGATAHGGPHPTTTEASGTSTSDFSSTASSIDSGDGSAGESQLPDGLIIRYDFEDDWTDGAMEDRVSNRVAACNSVSGSCPDVGEGVLGGRAAGFNGAKYFRIANDAAFELPAFTLCLWVYPEQLTQQTVISKPFGSGTLNSFEINYSSEGLLSFTTSDGVVQSPLTTPGVLQTMVHVAAVWNGGIKSLYVDGKAVGAQVVNGIVYDEHDLVFGIEEDHGQLDHPFTGRVDDFQFYDRALSPAEILVVINAVQ